MIRTIIVLLFVIIFLIISIPIWLVLAIIGLFNKPLKDKISFRIVAGAFHIVWWLSGVKPTVKGLEKVPTDKPVLYVANHLSFFDVILTYSLCPGVTGFLSKKTFEKVPLLNVWMHMNYCIFLTRTDPRTDLKLILKAIDYIKAGVSMFVFPEGTRSKDGTMADFHEATMKLATKTGCPVVPVAITGTRAILEDHLPAIKAGKVSITYCDPIDPAALTGDDKKYLGAYVKGIIEKQLEADKKAF